MRWSRARFKLIMKLWPFGNIGKKFARMPVLDRFLGPVLWNEKNLDATYIPVGEAVEALPGSFLPYRIIGDFVSQASRRFIIGRCMCRSALDCANHPVEIGCIFLGDAAADIDPALGRMVSIEETMAHVDLARNYGLLPCVIHSSFDASLLGIDYRKMLSVCFCCNCCCVFRVDMEAGPKAYRDRIEKLPGLIVTGAGDCSGCGACAEACFLGAIEVGPGGPSFAEFCKGCGRCADVCPRGNIRIRLEPGVDTEGIIMRRIGARTDISARDRTRPQPR